MEGDAGTRQLNPTDAEDAPDESVAVPDHEQASEDDQDSPGSEATEEVAEEVADRRPPRLGRGWVVGICAALLALTAAAVVGGVFLIRDNRQIETIARQDAEALQAAKECVEATNAPDTAAMSAAQMKIVECATGAFRTQATLYSGVLVEAYQAANVKVQVTDMRAAVERHDPDGSVDVLVALRVKVTNSDAADQEQGYRLRVKMSPDEGRYRIADLEQVTS
jgi:Mce-associated membrane protein